MCRVDRVTNLNSSVKSRGRGGDSEDEGTALHSFRLAIAVKISKTDVDIPTI